MVLLLGRCCRVFLCDMFRCSLNGLGWVMVLFDLFSNVRLKCSMCLFWIIIEMFLGRLLCL